MSGPATSLALQAVPELALPQPWILQWSKYEHPPCHRRRCNSWAGRWANVYAVKRERAHPHLAEICPRGFVTPEQTLPFWNAPCGCSYHPDSGCMNICDPSSFVSGPADMSTSMLAHRLVRYTLTHPAAQRSGITLERRSCACQVTHIYRHRRMRSGSIETKGVNVLGTVLDFAEWVQTSRLWFTARWDPCRVRSKHDSSHCSRRSLFDIHCGGPTAVHADDWLPMRKAGEVWHRPHACMCALCAGMPVMLCV